MTMKSTVFWDVTPCGSERAWRIGGAHSLHLQGLKVDDTSLRNVELSELHGVKTQKTVGLLFDMMTSRCNKQ
jgi:hypothetical protein